VLEDPFQPSNAEKRIPSSYLRRITIKTRLSDSVRIVARAHVRPFRRLPLTQEYMAQMLGVRRTSVTSVARQLQKEGLIFYHRGKVIILSMDLVQKRACECHHAVCVDRFGSPDGVAGPSDSARLIVYNFGFIEDCRMPVYYFQ
jgi:hypothetical protein